jgi:hypothetical protein
LFGENIWTKLTKCLLFRSNEYKWLATENLRFLKENCILAEGGIMHKC